MAVNAHRAPSVTQPVAFQANASQIAPPSIQVDHIKPTAIALGMMSVSLDSAWAIHASQCVQPIKQLEHSMMGVSVQKVPTVSHRYVHQTNANHTV